MVYPVIWRAAVLILGTVCCPFFSFAMAETLVFEELLALGLKEGYEVRIADDSIRASRCAAAGARADYFPQLSLRFGQEYVHVFGASESVVAVGDTIYSDNVSKYKHSLNFYGQYTLYDFGRRRLGVRYADQQVRIDEFERKRIRSELSRKLLTLYVEALKLQKQVAVRSRIADGHRRIFNWSQQLQGAGRHGGRETAEAAIAYARSVSELERLKVDFQNALDGLSFYTRKHYLAGQVRLADVNAPESGRAEIVAGRFPEVRVLDLRLERKATELAMAERKLLPSLTLVGRYGMYGSDDNSFADSLDSMSKRDASLSLSFVLPLFDGFAAVAEKRRLGHEINRLRLEKEKTLAELDNRVRAARRSFRSFRALAAERSVQQARIEKQVGDVARLADLRVTDQIAFARQLIELEQQGLDNELRNVDSAAAAILLDLLGEAGS